MLKFLVMHLRLDCGFWLCQKTPKFTANASTQMRCNACLIKGLWGKMIVAFYAATYNKAQGQ